MRNRSTEIQSKAITTYIKFYKASKQKKHHDSIRQEMTAAMIRQRAWIKDKNMLQRSSMETNLPRLMRYSLSSRLDSSSASDSASS